jgi:hypothetical protein
MYLKVIKGTETFDKLSAVWDKINEYNNIAKALVKELGFEKHGRSKIGVAGGISCIECETKPEGWRSVGKKYQSLYYPKANQKELLNKIESLPIVSEEEYNNTIGFEPQFTSLHYISAFASKRNEKEIVIKIAETADYTPKSDMIEITVSEYKQLIGEDF